MSTLVPEGSPTSGVTTVAPAELSSLLSAPRSLHFSGTCALDWVSDGATVVPASVADSVSLSLCVSFLLSVDEHASSLPAPIFPPFTPLASASAAGASAPPSCSLPFPSCGEVASLLSSISSSSDLSHATAGAESDGPASSSLRTFWLLSSLTTAAILAPGKASPSVETSLVDRGWVSVAKTVAAIAPGKNRLI
uniref:Uncharacterized protein n=1 Tax=Toxoplasma gondii TgCATBr9 TaxID=943120 RepID=A0A2T6IJV3_TOXGO|nr:hypothetical protein TGBR9_360020 [Toxoplasma gondii TgCATBr9]